MPIVRALRRDPATCLGLALVALITVVAVLAPWLAPRPMDAYESHPLDRLKPPGREFLFGTDSLGRDVLSRVLLGARPALVVAIAVVAAATAIGVPLGLVAGYAAGAVSETIMRVTDVFLAVPQLILALTLAQLTTPSLRTAAAALALTYWPFFTRIVFAETRRLRSAVFVEALEGLGASRRRVLFGHLLWNVAPPIIVRATIGLGFTILSAAVLGFLGMGAPPPDPDWGLAVAESRQHLPEAWWVSTFPGLAIFVIVLGFNLLGDGLRDAVDPRLRRSR
jgi:peptide/nickel transport system permease protein